MKNHAVNFVSLMTWDDVRRRLASGAAAILPVGAGAKQHGFHLPMNTDQIQAEWFAAKIAAEFDAIVWPTMTYGFYPAFTAYAGSASLAEATFESLVRDIVEGVALYQPRAILVLNTGISTIDAVDRALENAQPRCPAHHLKIYSGEHYRAAHDKLCRQPHGSHADEAETSIMLAIAPEVVDMSRAQASPNLNRAPVPGPLTPFDDRSPNYSPSGSFGDPTLATAQKGHELIEAIMTDLRAAISGSAGSNVRRPGAGRDPRPRAE